MRVGRRGWTGGLIALMVCALVACSGTPAAMPAITATLAVSTASAPFTPIDTPASTRRADPTTTIVAPSPVAPAATSTRATSPTVAQDRGSPNPQSGGVTLLVTNFGARQLSWVDPARGVVAQVEVGAAPWGLVLATDGRAYVSTAEGVAVVDTAARRRVALVPYLADVGAPGSGEYRAGGMGIALSPDGARVYVGVNLPGGNGRLEVLDTAQLRMVGSAMAGVRPFDVAVSRDGRVIYSIDHDSFSVTIVDAATLVTRTVTIAPAGRDAFAKMHYGVIGPDDRLLLPIMGRTLAQLAPSGEFTTTPLTANTHQHGAALTPDGRRLLIVGTGPAGQATGDASLTILDLTTGAERILPLSRPHEKVAVSPDGRTAYLTGGYTLTGGGWDGITVVELESGETREVVVPGLPLDVMIVQQ